MQKVPMTKEGAEKLNIELEDLKRKERPRIIKAIAEARAHGDLRENAEYHAAKEQQGMVEARVRDIEAALSNAQIVDITKLPETGQVIFGAKVYLINLDSDLAVYYRIVGEYEADVKQNKISNTSPLAKALIGKRVGDVVEVNTPSGKIEYEITKIEYK